MVDKGKIIPFVVDDEKGKKADLDLALGEAQGFLRDIIEHGREQVRQRARMGAFFESEDGGQTLLTPEERSEIYGAVDRLVSLGRLAAAQAKKDAGVDVDIDGIEKIFQDYDGGNAGDGSK